MTISPALRKNVAVVAFLTLLLSLLTFTSQPAFAAPAGTLTINDAGGDSLPTPSGGVYDIQSNVTIKPADIEAALASGAVTLWATSINVQSDIDAPNANALTLKATGSIVVNGGVDLTSQGGDLIFWSDSDADGSNHGNIRLGRVVDTVRGTIVSNGGDIRFGGGADFATGYAKGTGSSIDSKPLFGIAAWGFYINAGGGDISMRAQLGVEGSARAILLESANSGAIVNELITSGTGTISLLGDASTLTGAGSGNQWGVQFGGEFTSGSGDIDFVGTGGNGASNAIGILTAGTVSITSTSGDISFEDRTATTPNSGFLFQGGNHVLSTSGDITIQADEFRNASTSLSVTAASLSITPYTDSSFDAAVNVGPIDATNTSSVTIGAASNSANVTLNTAVTSGGSLTVHGANVALNAATSATTANLYASSAGSQTTAVSVTNLGLFGSGSYTLTNTSNAIGTVAAGSGGSKVSSLSIYDASGGLTIGQVGALEGITASGDVLVETGSGDITLAKSIATDSTASSAITLNAGDSTAAGTATGGNIVVSGSPTLTTGTGGIIRLFSGDDSGSTGLTTLAGGPSNTYYGVDETSSLSPALSTGTAYALYRGKETPQLSSLSNRSVTVGAASVTLTDPTATNRSSASVGGTVAWTTSNSSVASLSGATLTYGSIGTATVTATFTPTDTATYQSATTTFTVTVSSASSGGSSSSSSSVTVTPVAPVAPTVTAPTPRRLQATPNINPVPRPVERLGLVFDPNAPSRATVGGAIANLVKTPLGSKDLSIAAGAFQFGVSLADAEGGEVQTDTPSQSPELFVPRGQQAAVTGQGSYPGSFVQLFLPGNGDDSRELARIPVRSDGTFASDLNFGSGALELPVPIGRQVLQVVGYDELGNQTVVDMTVNIGQGVPAPEPDRQAGALPALSAGQSLATSGGIPESVSVTGVPEAGNVVVEGSGWVINVNADRENGVVETTDGNVLFRLSPSSVGTTSGSGFLPGTLATVWLFSEPTLVATVSVDDAGEFSAEFLVDQRLIAPGEHTLQVQGVGSDGYIKAANLGVLVEEPVELTTESASGLLWWVVGAFLLALVLLLFVLARRRRRDA